MEMFGDNKNNLGGFFSQYLKKKIRQKAGYFCRAQ